jgi:cellulose synthase/poly-beta-1,6-N-acetylglucosamine synthase-like glycosyltransferase
MFDIIFLIAVCLYLFQTFLFVLGANKKYEKLTDDKLPSITIIVAARNEEANILECMESLDTLDYSSEKMEIIIANDRSTDLTGKIIEDFIKDKPLFKTIIPKRPSGFLKGKANAIDSAIEIAKGDVIITTDADCTVDPQWAKTIALYYKEDVGIVCGYTTQLAGSLFNGMQMIDFVFLLKVAAGAMNLGRPNSCIGNNMSYLKSVYKESGGYERIPFSVTEDFKLLMAIFKLKKYKIIFPLDAGALVTSKPCPDSKSLYHQKKRWGVGGLESDVFGFSVMAVGVVTHILMLLVPFFFSLMSLILLISKILIDYFFVYPTFKKLNLKLKFRYFFAFEIYFVLYVIALPVVLLFDRKVKWKGREF